MANESNQLADEYAQKMAGFYSFICDIHSRYSETLPQDTPNPQNLARERVDNMLSELKTRIRGYRERLKEHPEIVRSYKVKYSECPTIEELTRTVTLFKRNPENVNKQATESKDLIERVRTGRDNLKEPLERI